jgi:hypothetical protein
LVKNFLKNIIDKQQQHQQQNSAKTKTTTTINNQSAESTGCDGHLKGIA